MVASKDARLLRFDGQDNVASFASDCLDASANGQRVDRTGSKAMCQLLK